MTNVIKKHSISSELAQKMVNAAVAKARELGVSENVAILDDGGNLKAFSRMDGASIPTNEIAQNKAYTALFGVSTQDFSAISRVTHRFWPASLPWHVWRRGVVGFPLSGRRICRGDRAERSAHGAERRRLRESSPGARIRRGACGLNW
jgi:hypothetical protein